MQNRIKTDLLIIGSGLAGSFAAIKAKETGAKRVTVVSKGKIGTDGASTFGAGIIYALFPDEDRATAFKKMASHEFYGAGLYDEEWLDATLDEYYERIIEMDNWGVKFMKTPDGKFKRIFTRWDENMIQLPGPQVMEAMAQKVLDSKAEVIGNTMITDLLTEDGEPGRRVIGAIGFDVRTGEFKVFEAKCVIMASGPCTFKAMWTGHRNLSGEGYVIAYRAGAELGGFEMGSNHIVTGRDYDLMGQSMLFGLDGYLVNAMGERFMKEYYPPSADKAITARMAAAVAMEVRGGRGPIYLDLTHWSSEQIENLRYAYPLTVKILEQKGVIVGNRVLEKIEQTCTWCGTITAGGGIRVNTKCESTLPGLYACGDAMIRRLHHPFCLTGAAAAGARAGRYAAIYAKEAEEITPDEDQVENARKSAYLPLDRKDGIEADHLIIKLQEALLPYNVAIIARADRLEKAIKEVQRIREEELPLVYAADPHYLRLCNEIRSMVEVAEMYLRCRLMRQESRESCLREDYPYVDNIDWLKWIYLKQDNGKMKLWTEDLPIEKYKIKPERKKYLHPVFEVARKRGVKWG